MTLAGAAVVLTTASLAAPVLELRPLDVDGVGLEVSLVHAPALWSGVLVGGTGLPTLLAVGLGALAVHRAGRPGTRALLMTAAGLVQIDTALLRIAAWDVLGSGAGVAGTRFGLLLLGASVGLFLLAAATTGSANRDTRTSWSSGRSPSAWTRFRTGLKRSRWPRWF